MTNIEAKRNADALNKSLKKTISNYEIIADMQNRKTAIDKLSKKIVSAWRGGGGA